MKQHTEYSTSISPRSSDKSSSLFSKSSKNASERSWNSSVDRGAVLDDSRPSSGSFAAEGLSADSRMSIFLGAVVEAKRRDAVKDGRGDDFVCDCGRCWNDV